MIDYLSFALVMLSVGGCWFDDPGSSRSSGRFVEGRITGPDGRPVTRAIIIIRPQPPIAHTRPCVGHISPDGSYKVDLTAAPWAKERLNVYVLALDCEPSISSLPSGEESCIVNLELNPAKWSTSNYTFRDEQARPIEGVEVTISTDIGLVWDVVRTDARGQVAVRMLAERGYRLRAEATGLRSAQINMRSGAPYPSLIVKLLPPIRGCVIDESGKPVPMAQVGATLVQDRGMWVMRPLPAHIGIRSPSEASVADKDGRFNIDITGFYSDVYIENGCELREFPITMAFADEKVRRIAFARVDPSAWPAELKVVLHSCRPVRFAIDGAQIRSGPELKLSWSVLLPLIRGRSNPVMSGGELFDGSMQIKGFQEALLPPGAYDLEVKGEDRRGGRFVAASKSKVTIPEGVEPHHLGDLRLEPLDLDTGMLAPEIAAIDLASGQPFTLASLRGKVVVLDFWGYWCGPCVSRMPELERLQSRFAGRPVTFLALHDSSIATREEYERRLANTKKELWNGRDLELRILLDEADPTLEQEERREGHGTSVRRFKVWSFPTLVVIDATGHIAAKLGSPEQNEVERIVIDLLKIQGGK